MTSQHKPKRRNLYKQIPRFNPGQMFVCDKRLIAIFAYTQLPKRVNDKNRKSYETFVWLNKDKTPHNKIKAPETTALVLEDINVSNKERFIHTLLTNSNGDKSIYYIPINQFNLLITKRKPRPTKK